jgi:hypothetical protein
MVIQTFLLRMWCMVRKIHYFPRCFPLGGFSNGFYRCLLSCLIHSLLLSHCDSLAHHSSLLFRNLCICCH